MSRVRHEATTFWGDGRSWVMLDGKFRQLRGGVYRVGKPQSKMIRRAFYRWNVHAIKVSPSRARFERRHGGRLALRWNLNIEWKRP